MAEEIVADVTADAASAAAADHPASAEPAAPEPARPASGTRRSRLLHTVGYDPR
jgi:hypothetical protein